MSHSGCEHLKLLEDGTENERVFLDTFIITAGTVQHLKKRNVSKYVDKTLRSHFKTRKRRVFCLKKRGRTMQGECSRFLISLWTSALKRPLRSL